MKRNRFWIEVGDKVKVKKDLIIEKCYGGDSFSENMKKARGKKIEIIKPIKPQEVRTLL